MRKTAFYFSIAIILTAGLGIVACSDGNKSDVNLTKFGDAALWPNGILVYKFDSKFDEYSKHKVQTAANNITNLTNVEVISSDDAIKKGYKVGYVTTVSSLDEGCYASVAGYHASSLLNISRECPIGSIMHEFFHALGIAHEQVHPQFEGNINKANIRTGLEGQFTSEKVSGLSTYDKLSIMHYDSWGASICGDPNSAKVKNSKNKTLKDCAKKSDFAYDKKCSKVCAVMVDSSGNPITRQRDYLTESDIAGINALYPVKKK